MHDGTENHPPAPTSRTTTCAGCGRAVDWRTDLDLNPAWLDDVDARPVLCHRCLDREEP